MKKILISILIICFLLSGNVYAFDKNLAQRTDVHIIMNSETSQGACNGVVIQNTENYATVLTAKHCVENMISVYVETHKALVIATSEKYDLAFLLVPVHLKNKKAVVISIEGAMINSKLYYIGEVLGLPIDEYGRALLTDPITKLTSTTLHIIKGCSGGGILDGNNRLVGILVTGFFNPFSAKSIVSGMVNIKSIKEFLIFNIGDWNGRY